MYIWAPSFKWSFHAQSPQTDQDQTAQGPIHSFNIVIRPKDGEGMVKWQTVQTLIRGTVLSGSALFAQAYLSQNFGFLWKLTCVWVRRWAFSDFPLVKPASQYWHTYGRSSAWVIRWLWKKEDIMKWKQITEAQISLCKCSAWSVPMLYAGYQYCKNI